MRAAREQLRSGGPPAESARIIRSWRTRLGLTQEGLAQALNVTFSTVSRWENGHVLPSKLAWRALQDLAQARGCPLQEAGTREPAD
jgi:putative transcriptional regulator